MRRSKVSVDANVKLCVSLVKDREKRYRKNASKVTREDRGGVVALHE